MKEVYINPEWTFEETIENIEAVKNLVWDIIASFSYFEKKEEIRFKRELKRQIFALNFADWKCERIIEYIYNDFTLEELQKFK